MKSMFWILFGLVGSALMPTLARAQGGAIARRRLVQHISALTPTATTERQL